MQMAYSIHDPLPCVVLLTVMDSSICVALKKYGVLMRVTCTTWNEKAYQMTGLPARLHLVIIIF